MDSLERGRSEGMRVVWLALLALTISGYQAAGDAFYAGFRVRAGYAMNHLGPDELAHGALFAFFGSAAAACAFLALRGLPALTRLGDTLRSLCDRPRAVTLLAAGLVLAASLFLATAMLGHAVTTDDEHVYRFIARTLGTGAVVAPSPGSDLEFFREQFIVLDDRVRFGKYPIGFPILLALGQAIGLETLVVPLLTALVVFPLHRLAERLADRRVAGVACLLYAASPQVWFTGATFLSQPASTLVLTAGLALLVSRRHAGTVTARALVLAGALIGFGVLVRPLPGVLFALVAAADVFATSAPGSRARLLRLLAFGVPVALVSAGVPLTNWLQTGSALTSGYQAFHAPGQGVGAVLGGGFALAAMSIAAAFVRLNFWLFGWPSSLLACAFAGRVPRPWLVWGVLGSELAYRVIAPKAGVGGTGPLYLFEAVPVLCVLAALGLARIARGATALPGARTHLVPALVALSIASLALFVPPKLADLGRMGYAQRQVDRLLQAKGPGPAVVFHEGIAPPQLGLTWAYFPRCNGPRLDDSVLFLRLQRAGGLDANVELWRRRFPGRAAWYFGWHPEDGPTLVGLEDFVRTGGQLGPEPSAPRE
ncbi:MAG: glycosyltransferase family 39 protein [Vicinamibacteria bacterium]